MTLKENIVPVVNNYHAAANSAAAAAVATTIAAAAATNGGAHQRTANAYQQATSPGPAHANGHDIYSHSPPEQGGYLQATSPQPNNAGPFQALAINRVSTNQEVGYLSIHIFGSSSGKIPQGFPKKVYQNNRFSIRDKKKYVPAETAYNSCRDQDSNLGYFGHNEGY